MLIVSHDLWPPPGPQRTSPTVPKNMPTPQRVQHNTPAMRKNPSLSRNGGSDAEIMELNQQASVANSRDLAFHTRRNVHITDPETF